jgi:hypothetical protein
MFSNQVKVNAAANAILRAARANPNITRAGLEQEAKDGQVQGWLQLPAVAGCNFSQWTEAMFQASGVLGAMEARKAAAAARRAA